MNLSIRKISAIFELKIQSMFTNMSIMVAPILSIGFVLLMKIAMPSAVATGAYLLGMGLSFNNIMGGIMMGSYPLSEEKEKNTLRVLMTSSVSSVEFIIGSILPSLLITVIINIVLIPIAGVPVGKIDWPIYLLYTTVTALISIIIGYVIGIYSNSQMQAGNLSMPIMLLFTLTPMFQSFNKTIENIMSFTYPGMLNDFVLHSMTNNYNINFKDVSVLVIWLIVCLGIFIYAYSKNGLDSE
ncbi:ABC transporter permease [Companilactobacillus nodensis]|nr:ABC transporter permease [Companilactobacillus nodensis]